MQQLWVEAGEHVSGITRWSAALPTSLWRARRITREDRKVLEEVEVDGAFLYRCAQGGQAVLVDSCSAEHGVKVLCDGVTLIKDGVVWLITSGDAQYSLVMQAAKARVADGRWGQRHLTCDADPLYRRPDDWRAAGVHMLLTTAWCLRTKRSTNPRTRDDILRQFAPVITVLDPELSLCRSLKGFDYSWAIRDVVARLCATQSVAPLVVFTARQALSINTRLVRTRFGVDGLVYLEPP